MSNVRPQMMPRAAQRFGHRQASAAAACPSSLQPLQIHASVVKLYPCTRRQSTEREPSHIRTAVALRVGWSRTLEQSPPPRCSTQSRSSVGTSRPCNGICRAQHKVARFQGGVQLNRFNESRICAARKKLSCYKTLRRAPTTLRPNPPSSGRQKGCAFLPPLMSNVGPQVFTSNRFTPPHSPPASTAARHAPANAPPRAR